MVYDIYCDGSCRDNGSADAIGAWGYIIYDESGAVIDRDARVEYSTTNQRMELRACYEGCEAVRPLLKFGDLVRVFTDSAYLHNCYTQKWYDRWCRNGWMNSKKQPVANRDLWENIMPYFDKPWVYSWNKVKGHANNERNNAIDSIVQSLTAAAKEGNN